MHLFRHLHELGRIRHPLALALGVFDGVHLGHQAVIREAVQRGRQDGGKAAILTFHPHPTKILRPSSAPKLLTTEQQDYELFSKLNVDACLTLDFTQELSRCPPTEFLNQMRVALPHLRSVIVGPNWRFGHQRSGNFDLLKTWGRNIGIETVEVPAVSVGDQVVSSTIIRRDVIAGDVSTAATRLGRPYQIVGRVVRGSGRGSEIGFPTANLDVENELLPARGVYAARALVDGEVFAAGVNIGIRPTLSAGSEITVEAHLLELHGQLYGLHLRLDFLKRLRAEQKFGSLIELQGQILEDVSSAFRIAHTH